MSALGDELLDALETPRGRALLRSMLLDVAREALHGELPEALRVALDRRDEDAIGGLADLAKWIGAPSGAAAAKRVDREPELAQLAIRTPGGHRRWRRSEVLGLVARRRKK